MSEAREQPGGDDAAPSRILLVEDDPADADLIKELLDETEHNLDRVTHVRVLEDAVAALRASEPDAVLLDLRLPDGFGIECVDAVRGAAGDVPIVVLTGVDDYDLALSCISAGAQDYISKHEVSADNLRRAVGYAIARTREQSARRRADDLQSHLAAIVEASSDAIMSSTLDGVITSWNRGAEKIFGFSREEAVGRHFSEVMRPANDDGAVRQRGRSEQLASGQEMERADDVVRLRRDGSSVVLSVVSCRLRDPHGMPIGVAATCRDVTDARRRDAELRQRNEQLLQRDQQMRALTARLNAIREEERTRISRTVHDVLGQLLTGLKMDLRWIARRVDSKAEVAISAKLGEAEKLVDEAAETVQRIALDLRPSVLDALGLAAAIRDEARRFEKRSGIATVVELAEARRLPADAATALFRILQELLTNVSRHAHASSVRIVLDDTGREWVLEVDDDGVGIVSDDISRPSSLGLLGVRERAEALGGVVDVRRGEQCGTRATVRVPR